MKLFGGLILASALVLGACGEETKKGDVEPLPLKSAKQELSYLMGAEHSNQLDQDPNRNNYDHKEMAKGFEEGLNNPESYNEQSIGVMKKLLGEDGAQFNKQYLKEGSNAIGKVLGATFHNSWTQINFMSSFDKKYLVYGFELGLKDQDTLIKEAIKTKTLGDFMAKVNVRITSEVNRVERVYFDEVKKKKGIQSLPQGLYLETIKAGTGVSPTISDDVKAHYVLMLTSGDTLQSSLGGEPVPFNLGGVIPGWSIGIPFMKKGGKYKLYVPQSMAYGANPPDQSIPPFSTLVFYVELIEVGKGGTLVKPDPMQGMQ